MQFASVAYLAFLAVSALVYFSLPAAWMRTTWLLAASLTFYFTMSSAWTAVLLCVIAIGYGFGLLIAHSAEKRRRLVAGIGIGLVIGVLGVFKYAEYTTPVLRTALSLFREGGGFDSLRLIFPIGISFWTFQTIAYLADIAKGTITPERNLVRYAAFIAFFGHVTAGPIARANQLLPQLAVKRPFSYELMRSGLVLMMWGFAKKLLVADPLGVFVDYVYKNPQMFSGSTNGLVLGAATFAFAIQIYCDFSGYTDIVRGSARVFGIELVPNFNRPYFARSVKEFWQRWHMSLMGWLKEYVYIPLGGSRVPTWRKYANILIVFLISGIWHGAGLTFVFWGLLNGIYQITGDLTSPARTRLRAVLRIDPSALWYRVWQSLITFVLISVAWVFFRAETLADALHIVPRMFIPTFSGFSDKTLAYLSLPPQQVWVALAMIVVVFAVDIWSARADVFGTLACQHISVRWAVYLAGMLAIVLLGQYGPAYNAAGFAYFKF